MNWSKQLFCSVILFASLSRASAWAECTAQVEVSDVIGPATYDLLHRAERFAGREGCGSILLLVNTPGGSLDSTRKIVELILNSKYPYLCLVAPTGAHAGSAGAIILQACHVNGAMIGTNLGAATPVSMGGEMPADLRKKILNDTRSWLESLTRLRGRSDKFGQDIIVDAKAVTAEDALRLKAVDFVGADIPAFLKFAGDRRVKMAGGVEGRVEPGEVKVFDLDARYKLVSILTDPEWAYVMLLGSLGLLYFEITHPGTMIAGVVGSIGLVVALIAMHKLEVEWGGLALILLGVAMLIAEMFVPSFGALGIGGLTAFVFGSLFLFDPVKTGGYRLPLSLILPVAVFAGVIFLGVGFLLVRTRRVRKKGGFDDLLGLAGRVVELEGTGVFGMIELRGEIWKFESPAPLKMGDEVFVHGYRGLALLVRTNPLTERLE